MATAAERQISINLVKDIFNEMFAEQNKKTLEMFKEHEQTVLSIISSNFTIINQRLDKLAQDITNNTNRIDKIAEENNEIKYSLETTQEIWNTKANDMKEEINTLKEELKERDKFFKEKLRIMEDRSRRNNIRVEGIPESENESWEETEKKLKEIIKTDLQIETEIEIERAHRVKKRNHNDEERTGPKTVIAKILRYKDKEEILQKAKVIRSTRYYFKEDFSNETIEIRKRLWTEVERLREEGKYAVINYDRIYSRNFRTRR